MTRFLRIEKTDLVEDGICWARCVETELDVGAPVTSFFSTTIFFVTVVKAIV